MRTTIELSESVYQKSEQAARQMGFSVEQLILRALQHELDQTQDADNSSKRVTLPLVPSKHPGALNLVNFDFDDLLA